MQGSNELDAEPGIHVGNRAAMMRGINTTVQERQSQGEGSGDGLADPTSKDGHIVNASGESDGMHNWKYLMSLCKAKLLSNEGRGRKINIMCGGLVSQTFEKTLRRFPGTLLTSMITDEDGALFYSDKVVLDRHPLAFVEILNAYREGVISDQPLHIAPETWIHELTYFQMHRANLPAVNDLLARYGIHAKKGSLDPLSGLPNWAVHVYLFLEDPSSSWAAWLLSVVSLAMIVISVVLVCVETLPDVAADEAFAEDMAVAELVIIVFFTVEYVGRFIVANRKREWLIQPMNLVDVIAIAPSYVFMNNSGGGAAGGSKIFRVLRVLRIFKLSRHSNGLQVLAKTAEVCTCRQNVLPFTRLSCRTNCVQVIAFSVELCLHLCVSLWLGGCESRVEVAGAMAAYECGCGFVTWLRVWRLRSVCVSM